ncbi:MAG: hypothetical protein R2851_09215 [Caldilineaceae bacterium]
MRPVRTVLVLVLVGLVFGLVARAPQTQAMVDWLMSLRPPNWRAAKALAV